MRAFLRAGSLRHLFQTIVVSQTQTPPTSASATGAQLRDALLSASSWLDSQVERINALNVFPVPDGDTGTNMSLTLRSAAAAIGSLPDDAGVGEVAKAAYQAAMMGARGNSGVILSQILRGFSGALAGKETLNAAEAAAALTAASDVAYQAVSHPVEGTILTVARSAAEAARQSAERTGDLPALLECTLSAAAAAVADTPKQLDVLRRAGVVDSGGEGYRVILEGVWMSLTGRSLEEARQKERDTPITRAHLDALTSEEEQAFGYCTEFLIQGCAAPAPDVKMAMELLGDSVIAVGDGDLMRVHLHTLRPGQAIEYAVEQGALAKVKVENLALQHQEFAAESALGRSQPSQPRAEKNGARQSPDTIGVIAIAPGGGFHRVFQSMGASVVEGGQTMNPSVEDVLAAVESSGLSQLIVLPNNENVILTAKHAAELTSRRVEVVETRSAPEGIGALLSFNFQADLATNVAAMARAAGAVHTIEVAQAVRDAELGDGLRVAAGQPLALYDGQPVAVASTAADAVLAALQRAPLEGLEIVTIYYGKGATRPEAEALSEAIRQRHSHLEAEVVEGGQPHYPFIVSLE